MYSFTDRIPALPKMYQISVKLLYFVTWDETLKKCFSILLSRWQTNFIFLVMCQKTLSSLQQTCCCQLLIKEFLMWSKHIQTPMSRELKEMYETSDLYFHFFYFKLLFDVPLFLCRALFRYIYLTRKFCAR